MMKSRILITGVTGYIGGNLCKELVTRSYEVFVIVRRDSSIKTLCEYLPEDHVIFTDEVMSQRIVDCHPDICIHLAGRFITSHVLGDISTLIESNITFPAMVCEAAYEGGCRKFINTGSYWQNYNNEEYNPVNYYAATKEAMKKIFQYYAYTKKCSVITLKIFDTYGKGDKRRKILNIISELREGDSIDMSQGIQKLYLCHIDDVINAYLIALERCQGSDIGTYEEFFLRGNESVTLKDVVASYLELSHKNIKINWGKREYLEKEILDPTGYGVPLPKWMPQIGLKDGLKKSFDL